MEGPSLVILKEELNFLKRKKVIGVSGNSKIDQERIKGQKIKDIRTFGKHFLIEFAKFSIRVHFLMFGSYRLNERKETPVRLSLQFDRDELNFYSCAIILIDEALDDVYDWSADVMSDTWSAAKARRKLKGSPGLNVGDALLDQNIFAGVGNIIKNEVLYRIQVHPNSVIGELPPRKLTALINEARNYSFDFFEWKKIFELRKHWLIYKRKKCRRCDLPVILEHTGNTPRRSFYCENCQALYA
jgi:endonuclease VIII